MNDPNDGTTSEPGGSVNHLRAVNIEFTKDAATGDDISDSSNAVLLLRTYKGEYPSQIVAVLNWSPNNATAYSLENLKGAVNIQGTFKNSENVDTDYFVMSNAVYAQGTTPVYATPLTMENIKTSETDAKKAPVELLIGVAHVYNLGKPVADGFLKGILYLVLDDEHNGFKSGTAGVVDGIVDYQLTVCPNGVDLLEAAVTAAHSRCHNYQYRLIHSFLPSIM